MSGILMVIPRGAAETAASAVCGFYIEEQVASASIACRGIFADGGVVAQTAAFAVCGFYVDPGNEPRTLRSEVRAT